MENVTQSANAASSTMTSVPSTLADVWALLMTFHALRDWLKLIVLGGALETCRRLASGLWTMFLESFFLTAHFEEADGSYDWMMVWLAQHPAWRTAREVQISTRDYRHVDGGADPLLDGEEQESPLQQRRKLAYLPSFGTTNVIYFRGHRMTVIRNRRYLDEGSTLESLTVQILTRSSSVLNDLLLEAKRAYTDQSKHRVSVWVPDTYNNWRTVQSRPKRPLSSVILEPSVKNMILDDAREFLASEVWYADRGIPFRRGYLLHGQSGAGKTSLINSLAGELGLDIYVISLAKRGLDDTSLNALITEMPARAIALMEDIDAAFTHDVQRLDKGDDTDKTLTGGGVTLSGLLGAIDGVAAQEGRLLFATTNHVERLDPALSRPGRMDVHVAFKRATRWQAAELFKAFYPPAESNDDEMNASRSLSPPPLDEESSDSESSRLLRSPSATPPTASTSLSNGPGDAPTICGLRPPRLSVLELKALADRFAACVPEDEFSMAQLQGHLMGFKTRPHEAVSSMPHFVERTRAATPKPVTLRDEPRC